MLSKKEFLKPHEYQYLVRQWTNFNEKLYLKILKTKQHGITYNSDKRRHICSVGNSRRN